MRALLVLAVVFAFPPVAHAKRAPGGREYFREVRHGPREATGVVRLAALPSGQARIFGRAFRMGSTPTEMLRGLTLCRKEILGPLCDELGPLFRAEGYSHEVLVSTFLMDRTEVTVGAYRVCVAQGACAEPGLPYGDPRFDGEDLPVTHVTWKDAADYCSFRHMRLPTEAEWELAARGPGRDFPWGMFYNPRLANHGSLAHDRTDASDGFEGLAPVGSFPDGRTPEGIFDLAGNVAEWVEDTYERDDEGFGYPPASAHNPHRTSGAMHVVRGGSYLDGAPWLRTTARGVGAPMTRANPVPRSSAVGFRCVKGVRE